MDLGAVVRALSIRPQWVEAILALGKRWENRDWPEGYAGLAAARRLIGQTIYLHAGQGSRAEYEADAASIAAMKSPRGVPFGTIRPWAETTRGALVATAVLQAVIGPEYDGDRVDPWDNGAEVGLVLADVSPLARPIPMAGKLGFFEVPAGYAFPRGPASSAPAPLPAPGDRWTGDWLAPGRAPSPAPAPPVQAPVPRLAAPDPAVTTPGTKAARTRLLRAAAAGDTRARATLTALGVPW